MSDKDRRACRDRGELEEPTLATPTHHGPDTPKSPLQKHQLDSTPALIHISTENSKMSELDRPSGQCHLTIWFLLMQKVQLGVRTVCLGIAQAHLRQHASVASFHTCFHCGGATCCRRAKHFPGSEVRRTGEGIRAILSSPGRELSSLPIRPGTLRHP